MEHVHLEDVLKVPTNARNLEREPLAWEEDKDELALDHHETRRSPGMMLEDKGAKVEEYQKNFRPGKLDKLSTGNFIAYVAVQRSKKCGIGKVISISKAEAIVIIHKYRPVSDCRLRLYWTPVYNENGTEVLGTGSVAATEQIPVQRILWPVQLHDGVWGMQHPDA